MNLLKTSVTVTALLLALAGCDTTSVPRTAAEVSSESTVTAPTASPTIAPDEPVKKWKVGPKPTAPKLLATRGTPVRVGATCRDGSGSDATGRGACSRHGGVRVWLYEQPSWVYDNKETNANRIKAYNAALKTWKKNTARNRLLADYPCKKGPYPEGSPGYASWRDTNDNGTACDR